MGIKGAMKYTIVIIILCIYQGLIGHYNGIWASQEIGQNNREHERLEQGGVFSENKKIQINKGDVVKLELPSYKEQEGVNWNWHLAGEEKIKIIDFFPNQGYVKVQGRQKGQASLEIILCNQEGQVLVSLVWNFSISELPKTEEKPSMGEKPQVLQGANKHIKRDHVYKTKRIQNKIIKITQKKSALYIYIKPCKEAKYYQIYRSKRKKTGYKKIGKIKKNIYKDSRVDGEKTYYYKVKAILKESCQSKNVKSIESKPMKKKVCVYLEAPKITASLTSHYLKINGPRLLVGTVAQVFIKERGGAFQKAASHCFVRKNQQLAFAISRRQFQGRPACYLKVRLYKKVNNQKIYSKFSNVISV